MARAGATNADRPKSGRLLRVGLDFGAGIFVLAWSAEHGPAMIGRMEGWSSARAASRPPQPVKVGARRRAYFDLVKKAVKAKSCPPPADPP